MNGPKIHGLEDHLLDQMKHWRGIGNYTEDFVEQSHQKGVDDEKRTLGLGSRMKAFTAHSKGEWLLNNKGVNTMLERVKRLSCRSPQRKAVQKKEEKKNLRIFNRNTALDNVENGVYKDLQNYKSKDASESDEEGSGDEEVSRDEEVSSDEEVCN